MKDASPDHHMLRFMKPARKRPPVNKHFNHQAATRRFNPGR
jgi:hypothetical protein